MQHPVVYVIDEYDVPGPTGRSVRIAWRGAPPALMDALRYLPPAFYLALLAWRSVSRPGAASPLSWGPILLTVVVIASMLVFAIVHRQGRSVSQLTWEARARRLEVVELGWLPLLGRRYELPFDALTSVSFEMGAPRKGPLPIVCQVSWGALRKPFSAQWRMKVRGIETRTQAMELLYRIGRAIGWSASRTLASDPFELTMVVVPSPSGVGGAEPIPPLQPDACYENAASDSGLAEPAYRVAKFVPSRFRGPFELQRWKPGEYVEFRRPPASEWVLLIGALAAGGIGWFLAYLAALSATTIDRPAADQRVLGVTVGSLVLGWFGCLWGFGFRRIVFDWARREVRLRTWLWRKTSPFSAIDGLVLRGKTYGRKDEEPEGRPFWCEVKVLLPGPLNFAIRTEKYKGDMETPYRMSMPMVAELAHALGVPWTWTDYPDS